MKYLCALVFVLFSFSVQAEENLIVGQTYSYEGFFCASPLATEEIIKGFKESFEKGTKAFNTSQFCGKATMVIMPIKLFRSVETDQGTINFITVQTQSGQLHITVTTLPLVEGIGA